MSSMDDEAGARSPSCEACRGVLGSAARRCSALPLVDAVGVTDNASACEASSSNAIVLMASGRDDELDATGSGVGSAAANGVRRAATLLLAVRTRLRPTDGSTRLRPTDGSVRSRGDDSTSESDLRA